MHLYGRSVMPMSPAICLLSRPALAWTKISRSQEVNDSNRFRSTSRPFRSRGGRDRATRHPDARDPDARAFRVVSE